jgi:FKBP-type peptidyl-prolyl cis-trans isomerase SlyD
MGRVVAVGEVVVMDFNHPMAGKTLNFCGKRVEVRELTPEDLQGFAGGYGAGGGCDCGCGEGADCSCGDDCPDGKANGTPESKANGSCSCGC